MSKMSGRMKVIQNSSVPYKSIGFNRLRVKIGGAAHVITEIFNGMKIKPNKKYWDFKSLSYCLLHCMTSPVIRV